MSGMVKMQFAEVPEFSALPKSTFEKIEFGGAEVYRYTFDPGWSWVEHAGSFAGADSCPVPHILFTVSGRLAVKMDDGSTDEVGEGECIVIPPGHDAWTVGDEAYVCIDLGPQIYERLMGAEAGKV
jgi:quercetin dioxygenase-like cupin family protein